MSDEIATVRRMLTLMHLPIKCLQAVLIYDLVLFGLDKVSIRRILIFSITKIFIIINNNNRCLVF